MNQSLSVPHPKIVCSVVVLLLVHLLFTYLLLSYIGGEDKVIRLSPMRSASEEKINRAPSGNIFSLGRVMTASTGGTDAENAPTVESNYQLGSIVRLGSHLKAVFISEKKKIVLGIGEHQSPLGTVEKIIGNTVTIKNENGESRDWQIFPTFNQPAKNQQTENQQTENQEQQESETK